MNDNAPLQTPCFRLVAMLGIVALAACSSDSTEDSKSSSSAKDAGAVAADAGGSSDDTGSTATDSGASTAQDVASTTPTDAGSTPTTDAASTPTTDATSTPTPDAGSTPAIDAGSTPAADAGGGAQAGPGFAKVYTQLLEANCSGCHGPSSSHLFVMGSDKDSTYAKLMAGKGKPKCASKSFITAGNPGQSLLFLKIDPNSVHGCGVKMPKGGAPIDSSLLKLVKDWIAAGAKN